MSLQPGTRLGPYEVLSALGAGGMGEVWRARDRRLDRDVALKVLPEAFVADPERLARFEREAKVLASLNHAHIGAILGLEETDGVKALVLELVEGPTLADRIAQGPIPIDEALPIARQIAEALEAAHEQGIIHRDLKPANIKIRPDGTVKVLDFGLAKALEPPLHAATAPGADLSHSPTLTLGAATQIGVVLGSAAYMSPEQARGRSVDKRTDIWAFGCVLFEMISGRRAFDAEDVSLTLARVLEREVDFSAMPAGVPARVRHVVALCLRKDVKQRMGDVHDVRLALEGAFDATPGSAQAPVPVSTRLWLGGMVVVTAIAVAAAGALAFVHFRRTLTEERSVRFQVQPPEKAAISAFALSPDGRYLAFVASGASSSLWVRPIDSLDARELPGTDGARPFPGQVFWSPDSRSIGFVANDKLKKISVNGGPPQTLSDAFEATRGAWGSQGVIVTRDSALQRLPEAGGVPVSVNKPRGMETSMIFSPQFLPDGRHMLFHVNSSVTEKNGVFVTTLEDGAQPVRVLRDATTTRFTRSAAGGADGHLLFIREGTLMAQPFDSDTLRVTGEIFPVAERVGPQFSVSDNGALAYMPGGAAERQTLVWLDRTGKQVGSVGPPGSYADFRLSPNGRSIVFDRRIDSRMDIWVLDVDRGVSSQITFDAGIDNLPIWSHDSLRILWPSNRSGSFDLYIKPASGTGQDELLIKMGTGNGWATDWSRDGKWVLYQRPGDETNQDLWVAPQMPDGSGAQKPVPYLHSQFSEENGVFSPDGRRVAYVSNESGRDEVYVQAFPLTSEKHQISTDGGIDPHGAQTAPSCSIWRRIAT